MKIKPKKEIIMQDSLNQIDIIVTVSQQQSSIRIRLMKYQWKSTQVVEGRSILIHNVAPNILDLGQGQDQDQLLSEMDRFRSANPRLVVARFINSQVQVHEKEIGFRCVNERLQICSNESHMAGFNIILYACGVHW